MKHFLTENAGSEACATTGSGFSASPSADLIHRYRGLLGSKLASELVRMLIDETKYDALLAGLPRGNQRLANLRKVIDWLRETERGAHTTPATVARTLAERIKNPPDIPEAALLDPAQDAVTIMTVHGAKGLTKRVVFLPDTSSKLKNDNHFCRVHRDQNGHPMLGIKIETPKKEKNSAVKSLGFDDSSVDAKEIRAHEFKNLFYVAMTRARDLVVISATVGEKTVGWLEYLEPLIGSDIPAIPYSVLADAAKQPQPESRQLPTVVQLTTVLESLPPTPVQPRLQRIPATRLAEERDELEMDHEDREPPVFQAASTSAMLGSLSHAVLEQLALNDWHGSVSEWLEILRDDFAVGKTQATALKNRIEQTRELMSNLTAGMQEIHPEFPFVLQRGDNLIDGTIDLLCRTTNGVAIFDYKFTEFGDMNVAAQYRGQMEIYYEAAKKRFPSACESSVKLIVVSTSGPNVVPIFFDSPTYLQNP